jgi:hypothetical protein
MITDQMLFIPRIFLHALVIFQALEDYLTEAVKVCCVGHLRIEKLRHERACGDWIVNLSQCPCPVSVCAASMFQSSSTFDQLEYLVYAAAPMDIAIVKRGERVKSKASYAPLSNV